MRGTPNVDDSRADPEDEKSPRRARFGVGFERAARASPGFERASSSCVTTSAFAVSSSDPYPPPRSRGPNVNRAEGEDGSKESRRNPPSVDDGDGARNPPLSAATRLSELRASARSAKGLGRFPEEAGDR